MAKRSQAREEERAARIRVPHDIGRTANDFGNKLFVCDTTIDIDALPGDLTGTGDDWRGRWVIIRNIGSVAAWFAFSTHDDAAVDATPTATDVGASSQTGSYIAAGEVQQRQLPYWERAASLYFVRITASGSTEILLELGDGE
jgi:hypothetical protein